MIVLFPRERSSKRLDELERELALPSSEAFLFLFQFPASEVHLFLFQLLGVLFLFRLVMPLRVMLLKVWHQQKWAPSLN
jgi:hypothetical protein